MDKRSLTILAKGQKQESKWHQECRELHMFLQPDILDQILSNRGSWFYTFLHTAELVAAEDLWTLRLLDTQRRI